MMSCSVSKTSVVWMRAFLANSITRSRSYRMDGATHKNNPDHPHNSENSIIHERIILPLTCAFISV
jgi:hypothetical protein